jgi:dipeptidyl aminopeptidase/acylaminoacyl peptidase
MPVTLDHERSHHSSPWQVSETNDAEALIKEARERQRRRRLRFAAVVVALVASAGIAYGIVRLDGDGAAHAVARLPDGPVVHLSAFGNRGELAFISGRRLWLLDGKTRTVHALPTRGGGFTPSKPMFSADGRWLAYLEERQNPVANQNYARLWIARADGTDPHVVAGLDVGSLFGWSPTTDVLAVSTGPERTKQPCPCFSPTRLRIVTTGGSSREVAHVGSVNGAVWSPDGQQIAVAEMGLNTARLVSYSLDGDPPRVWLSRRGPERLNGMGSIVLTTAGWWRHQGVGIWVFGDGMVHNNDATPLDAVTAPRVQPRFLGQTLSDGTTDAVAANVNGDLAIVTDHGGGRAAWQGKTVAVCQSTLRVCRVLPHRRGTVTLDPAWSPDGRMLAYVEAPDVKDGPWTQQRLAGWFAAHRVFLYNRVTGRVSSVAAAHGATAINWSRDGMSLLYVRGNALWLLPTLTGKPARIAEPLFQPNKWPQYYGQVSWSTQFAWASQSPSTR